MRLFIIHFYKLTAIIFSVLVVCSSSAYAQKFCSDIVSADKQKLSTSELKYDHIPAPNLHNASLLGGEQLPPGRYQDLQLSIANFHVRSINEHFVNLKILEEKVKFIHYTFNSIHLSFIEFAGPQKGEKMKSPILEIDPNKDPFGDLRLEPGMILNGKPTKKLIQRRIIEKLILQRFSKFNEDTSTGYLTEDGDVLVNYVQLPSGEKVSGYQLIKGEIAIEIVDYKKKNEEQKKIKNPDYLPSPYGYEAGANYVFTRSGNRSDASKIFNAGIQELSMLIGSRESVDVKRLKFMNASYFLYQGLQFNRGGDGTTRTFLLALSRVIFDEPIVIPQDIDVQAYVKDQVSFQNWMNNY